jgi:hypothetical protein
MVLHCCWWRCLSPFLQSCGFGPPLARFTFLAVVVWLLEKQRSCLKKRLAKWARARLCPTQSRRERLIATAKERPSEIPSRSKNLKSKLFQPFKGCHVSSNQHARPAISFVSARSCFVSLLLLQFDWTNSPVEKAPHFGRWCCLADDCNPSTAASSRSRRVRVKES